MKGFLMFQKVVFSLMAMLVMTTPGFSQMVEKASENRVKMEERTCPNGMYVAIMADDKLVTVEMFSAPREDGTTSYYSNAYDRSNIAEAYGEFNAMQCPRRSVSN